jgi:hypothetical protein
MTKGSRECPIADPGGSACLSLGKGLGADIAEPEGALAGALGKSDGA